MCARYSQFVPTAPNYNLGTPYPDGKPGYYDTVAAGGCRINRGYQFMWTSDDCAVKVQVGADGMVNLVSGGSMQANYLTKLADTSVDNQNIFNVRWADGAYPMASANCTASGVTTSGGGTSSSGSSVCVVNGDSCVYVEASFVKPNSGSIDLMGACDGRNQTNHQILLEQVL